MAKTIAQQRAAARERQRKYRERQRAAKAGAGGVTRDSRNGDVTVAPTTMRDSVKKALVAMKWLVASDGASVQQAKTLAEDVDVLRFQGETTKALSAQRALTAVLNDLGGTPTVRMMHELRSLRAKPETPEVPDASSDEAGKPAGNVSKFERPARRSS